MMKYIVEGECLVYWMGLLIGFDVGGDVIKVFMFVYNFYDSQDFYWCYLQVEGCVYFVGGFLVMYLCCGNVVLIFVCFGVGVWLGVNVGWLKFIEKSCWLLFQVWWLRFSGVKLWFKQCLAGVVIV